MYNSLRTVNDKIQKACEVGGVLLLAVLVLLSALQIAARMIGVSLPWPGQVAQYLLVAFTFLALPVLFRTGEDISFRPLLKRLSYGKRRMLYLFGNTVLALFFVFVAASATQAAEFRMGTGLSSVRWLKIGYVYLFMGLMMLVTILPIVEETVAYWHGMEETRDRPSDAADTTPSD